MELYGWVTLTDARNLTTLRGLRADGGVSNVRFHLVAYHEKLNGLEFQVQLIDVSYGPLLVLAAFGIGTFSIF